MFLVAVLGHPLALVLLLVADDYFTFGQALSLPAARCPLPGSPLETPVFVPARWISTFVVSFILWIFGARIGSDLGGANSFRSRVLPRGTPDT